MGVRYRNARLLVALPALALAAGTGACNGYDLLIHQHYDQASFSNKVDILWIIDNSNSMAQDQANLQESFGDFVAALGNSGGEEGEELTFEDIGDAIQVYQDYLNDRSKYLDFQMGFTTTQRGSCGTDGDHQTQAECDQHGVAGRLRPLPGGTSPYFLFPADESLEAHFVDMVDMGITGATTEYGMDVAALASCLSVCPPGWTAEVDRDESGQVEERRCVADDGSGAPATWEGLSEGHPWYELCHGRNTTGPRIPDADIGHNLGFLRDDATLVVVVVTDEGDATANLFSATDGIEDPPSLRACYDDGVTEECDCDLRFYLDFFESLDRKVVFAGIGPSQECNEQNSGLCMIDFYSSAAEQTGGLFAPINVRNDADVCEDANFSEVLGDIGSLIGNLQAEWVLNRVPHCPSDGECDIQVFVNGGEVPRDPSRENGWDYYAEAQSVRFYGDAVPEYNAEVDIYYLPEEAGGRPLPF